MHMHRLVPVAILAFIAIPSFAGAADAPPSRNRAEPPLVRPLVAAPKLKPRTPFPKPTHDELVARQHDDSARIKLTEGTGIRLVGTTLVEIDSELELDRAARFGVTLDNLGPMLSTVNETLLANGALIERPVTATEDVLKNQRQTGEQRSRIELPDLNLFYDVHFPGKTPLDVVAILDALNQLALVECATPRVTVAPPPATDIPPATPDFSADQGYFGPAAGGIDVQYARAVTGGRGEGLLVVDVEDGWTPDHEDFPPLVGTSGVNYSQFTDHGTAVIGEIAAVENGYGMTGIAPAAGVSIASPVITTSGSYNLADAIQRAISQSGIGDIIVVEQQVYFSGTDSSYCPPEWDDMVFSIAQTAVANGRVVIETAGNGGQNLDDSSRFGTRFNRNDQDSGAIYVGAGTSAPPHTPMSFSNYGSRLDVQGWGENIATLGYGALYDPNNDPRQAYTAGFSGTSGAAPMVTGAAAIIQAVRRARALPDFTSQQMRTALLAGATPQGAGVTIGPLPNLRGALAAIPVPAPSITATGAGDGSATITWSAVPGVSGYDILRKDSQSGPWNPVNSTTATQFLNTGLTAGKTYLYLVRAFDGAGNRSKDSNYQIATTVDYTDPQLSSSTVIMAKHIVEVRTAVDAICTFAGPALCSSPPFTGAALDEAQVRTQVIAASDFTDVQNQIVSLRSAIGASPATFRETPQAGMTVKIIHMEDLRTGAN